LSTPATLAIGGSVKLSGRKIRFSGLFSVSGPHRNYFPALFIRFPVFPRFRSNPENSSPPESLTLIGGQANLRGSKIYLFLQQLTGHRMRWRDSQTIDELKIMLLLWAEVKSD